MATSEHFHERWGNLSHPSTSANDRATNYVYLTSYLKESGVDPSFTKELCSHHQPLLKRILTDITCKSCGHAALQVLGYCLHNIEFASKFTKEQVDSTIKGLCGVVQTKASDKPVCTRALWCLTNQQLPVEHMTCHVTTIVDMATEVITVRQAGVATVNSEALNLLTRFGEQFPALFAKLVTTWYKAAVELITSKVHKVQQKALSLALKYESHLHGNHHITHWLTKILKERLVSALLSQLTEKGLDHCHLLNSWAHFVTVLGKSLHKHGSFLNELLRVVETGFKHKSPQVQISAYNAWRALITNFSLDLNVMTSQKRLKLLMMPLLASAVRERHEAVEQARIKTWWHLIGCLGMYKASHFNNVCIPFLLLCLGVDPKSDISQLSASISDIQSYSHSTKSNSNSTAATPQTPKSSETIHLAVTPTPYASSAPSSVATPTSSLGAGRLLSVVCTPRSSGGVEIEKAKKSSDRYQAPPNISMVMTGCHALLKFTGFEKELPHSLIESEANQYYIVFPKSIVPMETAQFMLLFLDTLLAYSSQLHFKENGVSLEDIVYHIVTAVTISIEAEDGISSALPESAALLVPPLVDLLHSGAFNDHLGREKRINLLSHLVGLSPRLLLTTAGGRHSSSDCWKKLVKELLTASKEDHTSEWFSKNWKKLTNVMLPLMSMPLSSMLFLSDELGRLFKAGGMERETCCELWSSLANSLISYISQTSQVNSGTNLNPCFKTVRQMLKFPFVHLLDHGERSPVTSVMDIWKCLYEMASLHVRLVVKEANLCTEMVCSDLYSAYGQYMKQEGTSMEQKHQVLRFDLYQNAVASALSYVVSKIKWSSIHQGLATRSAAKERGGRAKSLEMLFSLLAWQLATFWDTTKKGPLPLSQLTTPYTLLDLVESLYRHIPNSSLITMATEMIGQPLATLFEAVVSSCSQPSTGRSRTTQQDLEHRVEKAWKAITICFKARYAHPYDSTLLSTLSPLLVAMLNSSSKQLSGLSLSFWAVTFDKAKALDYPARLRDYFIRYLKDLKQPSELKLPGFHSNHKTLASINKEIISMENSALSNQSEVILFTETQSHSQLQNRDPDVTTDSVLLPHPSPRKGVCGSFLNRQPPGSPYKPIPAPSSPHTKQLDEVLARASSSIEKVQSSPLRVVGVADGSKNGSPIASARRRLDLGSSKEDYVSVSPPLKKRRLLTEHQKEVMRERKSDLPTLYNALDPSLDSAPLTMATQEQQSEELVPVITLEPRHPQPTASHLNVPGSVPDSIPIPHSRHVGRDVAPTSRDTPITIPDSPPLTPPPLSLQHTVSVVTTAATDNVSVNPSLMDTTSASLAAVAPAPTDHAHPSAPPLQAAVSSTIVQLPSSTSLSSLYSLPFSSLPPLSNAFTQSITTVSSTSSSKPLPATSKGTVAPPLISNPSLSCSSHEMPVVITQPGLDARGTVQVSQIEVPVQGLSCSVAPPLLVHQSVTTIPSVRQLVAQTSQSCQPPQNVTSVPRESLASNGGGGVVVASVAQPTLPTSSEIVSEKEVVEEAVVRPVEGGSESVQKRRSRRSAGTTPANQGNLTMTLRKRKSLASSSSEDAGTKEQRTDPSAELITGHRPSTSTDRQATAGARVSESSGATTIPSAPLVITSSSTGESSNSNALLKSSSSIHEEVESSGELSAKKHVSSEKSTTDKSVAEKPVLEAAAEVVANKGVSAESEPMEENEDPLSGVSSKKKKVGEGEGGQGSGPRSRQRVDKVTLVTSGGKVEVKVLMVRKTEESAKSGQIETDGDESVKGRATKISESNSDSVVETGTKSLESDTKKSSDSKPSDAKCNETDSTKAKQNEQDSKEKGVRKSLRLQNQSTGEVMSEAVGNGSEREEAEGGRKPSLVDTPTTGRGGILKHTSQFDSPSTAKAGRRVQFATQPVFHEPQPQEQLTGEEDRHKTITPKHSRSVRTPPSSFSSRRTLMLSQTPPKMILVNKPLPPATPNTTGGPVYPSLTDCQSPVEQILPALSPSSKFTHGLLQLVSAQNITTVGSISSLSEQEVQVLPIKSPKVQTLRGALRSFELQLQGSKRKSSIDSEAALATPPPRKQTKVDSDLLSSVSSTIAKETSSSEAACDSVGQSDEEKKTISSEVQPSDGGDEIDTISKPVEDLSADSEELSDGSCDMNGPVITLCTPESQLTMAEEMPDIDYGGGEGETGAVDEHQVREQLEPHAAEQEEEMDVEGNLCPIKEPVFPDSPPKTPPTSPSTTPPLQVKTKSSVSHDHTYCSPEKDGRQRDSATLASSKMEARDGSNEDRCLGEPSHSALSLMVHDHTYCSQNMEEGNSSNGATSGAVKESENKETSDRSKLSHAVHDHTYCSSVWQEKKPIVDASEREEEEGKVGEGSGAMEKTNLTVVSKDSDEMEIGTMDDSMDSDVFTETDSSSSQSQELFSQQTSQVRDQEREAPPTDTPTSIGQSRPEEVDNLAPSVVRGNHSAKSAKRVDALSNDKVKVQLNSHVVSTGSSGSSGSSDSSNPTHIAECSQRPPSFDQLPSTSPAPPVSDSSPSTCDQITLVDSLSLLKEVSEKANKLMEEKSSLTREEIEACQKTVGSVSLSAQKLFEALTRHLT